MIIILSNTGREAAMIAALCSQRSWPGQACTTVSEFTKLIEKTVPRVVVVRHHLDDGYSDDVLTALHNSGHLAATRVIVLVQANCTSSQEARQVTLGADCVLRDPLRVEVFLAYAARYCARNKGSVLAARPRLSHEFAGVRVLSSEHRLQKSGRTIPVAPKVIELLQLLSRSTGKVVPYPVLYTELFNRRFAGDTANCRVLLAKAASSFALLGTDLRAHIKVIPKSGYVYTPPPGTRPASARQRH